MIRQTMHDYAQTHRAFTWQVPPTFNFGADAVDRWAEDPDRLALIWANEAGAERRFTFTEIARASNRFANLLADLGIRRGDRLLVMLPRLPQWQVAMVGCLKLGAIPIPCIDMLTAGDVAYRLQHSGARGAVTTRANVAKFAGPWQLKARVSVGGGEGWLDFDDALQDRANEFGAARLAADEPAILYYTSGSTGKPKGVTHASRALFAWRVSAWYWPALTAGDLMWCTADTGWSKAGTSILFGPWSCGSAAFVVLRPGSAASDALAKEIQEHVKRATAPYKYPRKVEFVAELPKTATGKIRRRELRDREYAAAGKT